MKKIQNQLGDHNGRPYNLSNVVTFFGLGIVAGLTILIGIARITWHSNFYPGIKVGGISIAGLTRDQARDKLKKELDNYQAKFVFNGSSWQAPKGAVVFELENTLNEAYHYGRRLQIADYLLLLVNKKTDFPLRIAEGRTDKLEQLINEIATSVEIPPVEPTIEIVAKKVRINNGTDGTVIDSTKLNTDLNENYKSLSDKEVAVPTITSKKQLNSDQIALLTQRTETLVGKQITMTLDDQKIVLDSSEIVALLSTAGSNETVNKSAVYEYAAGLGESLNKPPQDAKFEFLDGKVKEFAPGKDGVEISEQITGDRLKDGIDKLLNSEDKSLNVEIAVNRTPPEVTTDEVNKLGIRERIGRGESFYAHSIPNRIYNVALASERINSALIGPGEEVSFNKMVGEVSGATGYRPAYVIEKGRTVLGDGGGLCQVSTTMFRAAMSAGLPILERWGHAYRVSYYELDSKPGVDATVYAPSKDFKFKNDTPGHLLIQTINDPKALHLVIEIYGTSDGRVATMENHKVWGITPALPTIYQDDPSLPLGTTKQVDWSATGAKASFEYKVTRNGETIQDKTFSTVYRPWASVFLKGTGQ